MMGLEPTTPRATTWCSDQLSYIHHKSQAFTTFKFKKPTAENQQFKFFSAPWRIRTSDQRLRRPLLYPLS